MNMAETAAKYHHLIPQTYMSAWANNSGTLKIEFINEPGIIVERNKEHIAGMTDYHSIRAGMPICTATDATEIFKVLSGYTVECDGEILSTPLDLNSHYHDFDKWIVTRPDGSPVSKKHIKHEIEQVKIKDIEFNWSVKYENNWCPIVLKIEASTLNVPTGSIPEFDKAYLMRFFTALDWRGFSSNKLFEETYENIVNGVLDNIQIPKNERVLPSLETAADEMRHALLLQFYRRFLNDQGVIYKDAMANLANTNFHFLISDGPTKFITCDSPAFIHKREDGKLLGLLPITPRILMAKGRNSDNTSLFFVTHITDEAVIKYNNTIRGNAEEFIIHPA